MTSDTIDLESFRQERGLSYRKLAELIGVSQGRLAMAYAIGAMWPGAYVLDDIVKATDARVTVEAMHRRRLQWLQKHKPKLSAEETNANEDKTLTAFEKQPMRFVVQ